MLGEQNSFKTLQNNLIEAFRRYQAELNILDVSHGEKEKEHIQEDRLMDSQMGSLFTLTEQSLNQVLEESYDAMKSFITLTETNQITQSQIFTCSRAALIIAKLIQLLNQSSPSFWSAASSSLTSLQEYTNYARQTSSDIFGDMERVQAWCNFIRQAESTINVIGNIGIRNFGKIFPVTDSMQGNIAPSREARESVAGTIGARTGLSDGVQDASSGHMISYGIQSNIIGRQDHNGGNGMGFSEGIAPTLTKADQHGVALSFSPQATASQGCRISEVVATLDKSKVQGVMQHSQVRRLTPTECERLQGFPDGYTLISEKTADGPRYKALGNSMAVPVMKWIGERIQLVEDICN
jgi:site-specific DNA-cytosine methylase